VWVQRSKKLTWCDSGTEYAPTLKDPKATVITRTKLSVRQEISDTRDYMDRRRHKPSIISHHGHHRLLVQSGAQTSRDSRNEYLFVDVLPLYIRYAAVAMDVTRPYTTEPSIAASGQYVEVGRNHQQLAILDRHVTDVE
jgi:hypothetical protein